MFFLSSRMFYQQYVSCAAYWASAEWHSAYTDPIRSDTQLTSTPCQRKLTKAVKIKKNWKSHRGSILHWQMKNKHKKCFCLIYTFKGTVSTGWPPVSMTPVANLLPVSTTPAAKFATSFTSVADTGGKFATGVNDTGGKFGACVNDTGGKQWD